MLTLETAMGPVDISADRLEERKRLVQKILSSDSEDMVLHHVKGQLELLDKIEVVPPRHCSAPLGTAQPREFRSIEVLGHLRDGILRLYNKLEQCD